MSLSHGQLELFTESSDVVIVILETPHETSTQHSEDDNNGPQDIVSLDSTEDIGQTPG